MSRRKQTSGGQAIVLVSLALFSMAGMMGLAVDLGWSYFTQKVAQASADGAALAAVHEAWARRGGLSSGWTCGTGTTAAYCQAAAPADCATIQSDTGSNLYHGCLYAKNIGFNYASATSRQNVRIQADVGPALGGSFPPTVTGILPANMVYWVTVRSVQTIPQLFSSLLGNTNGTVAAIATAAAVNTILPGSFYGLNHEGDCLTDGAKGKYDCGVDIDVKSAGNTTCLDASGNNTNITGKVCAAGGIYLASSCNGGATSVTGCTDPGNATANFAGSAQNNATVWGGNSTIVQNSGSVTSDGKVAGDSSWIPAHTNSSNTSFFQDPTHKLTQPPLVSGGQIGSCGIPSGGAIPAGTWGPYQYYSYSAVDAGGKPIPDGKPLTVASNNTVAFASNGSCPGYSTGSPATGNFPNYIFYGGLVMNPGQGSGGNNTTINFGAGQYVMAGTLNNTTTSGCDGPCVFAAVNNGNLIDNSSGAGTQFIFTDTKYPGLDVTNIPNYSTALNAQSQIPNLVQGDIEIKNVTATLTAPQPATGSTLAPWTNILFWQDRRNSADTVDVTDGSVISQSGPCSGCNVTNTSPRFLMGPGGAALTLTGVLYQPRGAWFELTSGGSNTGGAIKLQLITGALTCGSGGCGSATVQLLSPTAPIIEFVTALIQ
jgi:Flp pilus assembly protein TadG